VSTPGLNSVRFFGGGHPVTALCAFRTLINALSRSRQRIPKRRLVTKLLIGETFRGIPRQREAIAATVRKQHSGFRTFIYPARDAVGFRSSCLARQRSAAHVYLEGSFVAV